MATVIDTTILFREHIEDITARTERALDTFGRKGPGCDGILFHAGTQLYYHADDHAIPFHTTPHFARFAPVPGPDHLLLVRPGIRPRLFRVVAQDYWYEPPVRPDHPYTEVLDVTEVASLDEALAAAGDVKGCAYFGNAPDVAQKAGIAPSAVEPELLRNLLDWERAFKTSYEVECIREASRIAARGHRVVREGAAQGHSERALYAAWLDATGMLEHENPYGAIIGWDEHAATLHYESKVSAKPARGTTLLIDAGATHLGYASDVTRTYTRGRAPEAFAAALDAMDALERELVGRVGPGVAFTDLHVEAHRGVARILCEIGVSKVSADELYAAGLTFPFLPHGLGHHLGLQVHDVGGRMKTPEGELQPPPPDFPHLRTTRDLAPGHVVTIEPGLYFIPMLLDPKREEHAKKLDWKLVDALVPCGGIRVEDDVLVTESGFEDLTRELISGHRD